MTLIYKTENFKLESVDKPFIDRLEGAHIQISAKSKTDKSKLSPKLKDELEKFIILVSNAIKVGRKKRGIEINKIDLPEEGAKEPKLPMHMYCRSRRATMQKYSEPVVPKHKAAYQPLDEKDIQAIAKEIKKLLKKEKLAQEREEREASFQNKFPGRSRGGYSQISGQKPPARQEHRQRA